jgi:hypothetical protein|nr:hypothetical protein [uncultured Carboxylicivirga sp.]
MKRYFVITHQAKGNGHLNVQDLLPASCKLITGIAVNAIVKQETEMEKITDLLAFPKALITELLQQESVINLFYSYLRTRSIEAESKDFFESDILPEITRILSDSIKYTCLNEIEQQELKDSIVTLYETEFSDYLYNEVKIFTKGKFLTDLDFSDLIAQQTLVFAYSKREDVFLRTKQAYKQPKPYECGNISLLVNGNSFLLRDYMLTANRKVKHMSKEIIPFHEPLEVNSNIHTIFKSNKNSDDHILTIRIYIEYEHE